MFKKVLIVGAAGLLIAAVLTQTKVGKHLSRQWDKAEQYLENQIPPEEEVARIKKDVASLDKDIDKAKGDLACENVECRELTTEVARLRTQTESSRAAVEARGRMVKEATDTKFVKWDGRSIDFTKAKEMLASEVKNHKSLEKQFQATEKKLAVHEQTRTLAEQHLQALISEKAQLESDVTDLEAMIKQFKIEQVQSKYQNDGTRMAQVKEDLAKLKKRIAVQREKLNLTRKFDPNSVENKSVDEILADLDNKSEKAANDQVSQK
jgi:peptidoglycan hydrolase CwlO-like protein